MFSAHCRPCAEDIYSFLANKIGKTFGAYRKNNYLCTAFETMPH